jgi:hypothetical protein
MLGCQDFCGYYDWTFHYLHRRWGQESLHRFWAEAIGGESQQHYAESALRAGLRGLYEQWTETGVDESCDWTFTLDEAKNTLRWDMRECPSKGFLTKNNLNADEDYSDHCMGWTIPMLASVGAEIVEHEHNHCGQCWGTIRMKDRPAEPLEVEADIRKDPRWKHGFLHRWEHGQPQPLLPSVSMSSDPCDVLAAWFAASDRLTVLGHEAGVNEAPADWLSRDAVLTTDSVYADRQQCPMDPLAVLMGDDAADLTALAARFHATAPNRRPLLLHPYLPRMPELDLVSLGLPRALPILPLLIRRGLYTHQPNGPTPKPVDLLILLGAALQKSISLVGVNLRRVGEPE